MNHGGIRKMVDLTERYIIRYGEFGTYFYDTARNTDLTLEDVKALLNKKMGD